MAVHDLELSKNYEVDLAMYYGHTSNLDSGLFTKKGTNLQDNISRKKTIQNMSEFLPLEIFLFDL